MAHSSANSFESFEDSFFRERLQAGDLSPGEFAEQVAKRSAEAKRIEKPEVRREFVGPLYRRGEWSPLRRAWLCLQFAVAAGLFAAYLYGNDLSASLVVILAIASISSLSLGILLLARSSAVYEIRALTRDRNAFKEQAKAHAVHAESLAHCVSWIADETPPRRDSGASAVRWLLEQARRSLVATGHDDVLLLVLRHERECALVAYSALPPNSSRGLSPRHTFTPFELATFRDRFTGIYSTKLDFGNHRQELLAISERAFDRCDHLALDHLGACLSLTAARSFASD